MVGGDGRPFRGYGGSFQVHADPQEAARHAAQCDANPAFAGLGPFTAVEATVAMQKRIEVKR